MGTTVFVSGLDVTTFLVVSVYGKHGECNNADWSYYQKNRLQRTSLLFIFFSKLGPGETDKNDQKSDGHTTVASNFDEAISECNGEHSY